MRLVGYAIVLTFLVVSCPLDYPSLLAPTFTRVANAELFSALVDLHRMLDTEKTLYETLMKYSIVENSRLQRVSQLARDINKHHESVRATSNNNFLANPLNAFLLLKRFSIRWQNEIERLLNTRQEPFEELQREFSALEGSLPSKTDLKGSIDAIIRLQKTYQLDTRKMADGEMQADKHSMPFTAEECFYIGHHCYLKDDYHYAQLWMTEALRRLDEETTNKDLTSFASGERLNRSTVLDYLAYSLFKDDVLTQAAEITNQLLEIEPDHPRALKNMAYFKELFEEGNLNPEAETKRNPTPYEREQNTYMALCRGEDLVPYAHRHQLYCRYFVPHPHYLIGPVKEEIFYFDPRVVLYHDIIHEEEMKQIMEVSTPKLRRATIQNSITGKLETADYRVSKSAWLQTELNEVTQTINNRIIALTGLNIETAEDLQVVNYGLGGQYEPHFDFARRREKTAFEKLSGNRIATLIYYMSDVEAGGFTVFTELGLHLKPKKGAAAFWFNLLPSGDGDLATRHAACPVLLGSKWVMNKWFHERGQEFRRPCMLQEDGLDYDSTYRIKRNPDLE